ncbi:hypothetical protein CW751_12950 [Brumimicrobium salinarum]|uniref:Lipoprotein n=1 Tax=Brumimicrobium salinarum TaxID=2058658 RepID=A0A2I0QZW4_9FLAO|nr:hypothetical protein [Brumimicrobium salinarum]PKR79857.1 hypothetical protein CW751_12950 [Brumimicrobium salinarum]
MKKLSILLLGFSFLITLSCKKEIIQPKSSDTDGSGFYNESRTDNRFQDSNARRDSIINITDPNRDEDDEPRGNKK